MRTTTYCGASRCFGLLLWTLVGAAQVTLMSPDLSKREKKHEYIITSFDHKCDLTLGFLNISTACWFTQEHCQQCGSQRWKSVGLKMYHCIVSTTWKMHQSQMWKHCHSKTMQLFSNQLIYFFFKSQMRIKGILLKNLHQSDPHSILSYVAQKSKWWVYWMKERRLSAAEQGN